MSPKREPFARNKLIRDAIGQALHDEMKRDPSIHLFGEGCHVKIHYDAPAIEKDFPDRIHPMPIAEDGIVNFCVGAALLAVKPVVDIITADFSYRAFDSICNTAAKINFIRPGEPPVTLVIRAEFLTGGPTTGQRPEALFCHIPGLNVVIPSTPRDAYGLMRLALQRPGVTLFFEDREIRDNGFFLKSDLELGELSNLGKGIWRSYGPRDSVTIVTYGVMRQRVEEVLQKFEYDRYDFYHDEKVAGGVIDLRSLYPIDWYVIRYALENRSRKLLIVEPDVCYGGVGAEIAAWVAEELPGTPVKRLGAKRETISANPKDQQRVLPTEEEIINAVRDMCQR